MSNEVKKGGTVTLATAQTVGELLMVGADFTFDCDTPHDIDASAFLLGEDRRIRSDADFIFYITFQDSIVDFNIFSEL